MQSISVAEPRVLVLVDRDSPGASSNAVGHLFEDFIGKLLERFGYGEPRAENLRVTARGVEIDLEVRHRLTGNRAIAECKAYTSPVRGEFLQQFYGTLTVARFDDPDTQGFFIALPRLTAEGQEQAALITERDNKFRLLTASTVVDILNEQQITGGPPSPLGVTSDPAVVVSEHGVFSAAIELDPVERTAVRVLAWGQSGQPVPMPVLELLSAAPDYGAGIPAVDISATGPALLEATGSVEHEPLIATVAGSASDFEYQLPASPKFFVGRKPYVAKLADVLSRGNGVVVLNAQSGSGKSSLALRFGHLAIEEARGHALVVDTRTASTRAYLTVVLRRAALEAERAGLLRLPQDPSWATLASALRTLSHAAWKSDSGPLVIFFDQFENVFKDAELTREFRDLALGVREVAGPLVVGFAWKTNLVGWTEGHPYQLRDEIRAHATVLTLGPLGAPEVETLLRRLEKALGQRLLPDLRQRLREYSQGLPWLLKKLASHLIRENEAGTTQEQLLAEALNVQNLFEVDLAQLQPAEQEALRFVARYAPVAVTEVMERVSAAVVQSLLDQRLLVQVGERLDTYWDIFRDFLNTGRIPIEDSYILRQTPTAVARLLAVLDDDGTGSVPELAARLNTSENGIFNLSRDLRLMGVTTYEPKRVHVNEDVWRAEDREGALRLRVVVALRRHRAYTVFTQLCERGGGKVTLPTYATELPSAFPAVAGADKTWLSYARAFVWWFEYAGLARLDGQLVIATDEGDEGGKYRLLGIQPPIRVRGAFPQQPPGPAIHAILALAAGEPTPQLLAKRRAGTLRQLVGLGVVHRDENGALRLVRTDLVREDKIVPAVLREIIEKQPGLAAALAMLEANPAEKPEQVGEAVRAAYGADWTAVTTYGTGKHVRGWARYAGIATSTRPCSDLPAGRRHAHDELQLFLDDEVGSTASSTSSQG